MIEKKLKIDISPFWANPNRKFIVRFQDLQEKEQLIFTERIKKHAIQKRIKADNGPTLNDINETLKEINPIIFSQDLHIFTSGNPFNQSNIQSMSGWYFKRLCEAIYKIDCLKKPLNRQDLSRIISLSATRCSFDDFETFLNSNYNNIEEARTPLLSIADIGMEEIANSRRNIQNNIPVEIREASPLLTLDENTNEDEDDEYDFSFLVDNSTNEPLNNPNGEIRGFDLTNQPEGEVYTVTEPELYHNTMRIRRINSQGTSRRISSPITSTEIDRLRSELENCNRDIHIREGIINPYRIGTNEYNNYHGLNHREIRILRDRIDRLRYQIDSIDNTERSLTAFARSCVIQDEVERESDIETDED